jgi:hypothetical protein
MTERNGRAISPATQEKRNRFMAFVRRKLEPFEAVKGAVVIGSVGSGVAHPGSDIDAALFLDPFDPYLAPAEAIWRESDDTFHSIFTKEVSVQEKGLQFDFKRLDGRIWSDPARDWPEPFKAEIAEGWIAFDRHGEIAPLIAERTAYSDAVRLPRLDEAIVWLDQHLADDGPSERWRNLGPFIAHDRLRAAYDWLMQAIFAVNRRWRVWRNREATALLNLPWSPMRNEMERLIALNAPSLDEEGYLQRAALLKRCFSDVLVRLQEEGAYGNDPVSEAFIRSHDEPGRAWNIDEWSAEHRKRCPI